MARDKAEGVHENKMSEKGRDSRMGHQSGAGKVSGIEHVGSSSGHGVRFKMPTDKEVCDHSVIKKLGA
jgi:hypothetical protein